MFLLNYEKDKEKEKNIENYDIVCLLISIPNKLFYLSCSNEGCKKKV